MKEDIVYGRRRDGRSPLVITCAGASYCDGSYHIARRGIPILVAEYVVSGRGVLVVDGEQYTPEAGDVYLVPPNSTHYYASDRTNPWVKLWFNRCALQKIFRSLQLPFQKQSIRRCAELLLEYADRLRHRTS